ncbi:hypothetical protein ACOJBO_00315 [Rhizobium beringeri]
MPKHDILMAYAKGAEFGIRPHISVNLTGHLSRPLRILGKEPVIRFLNSINGIELVGAAAVQPFADTAPTSGNYSTLVFSKQLSPAVI